MKKTIAMFLFLMSVLITSKYLPAQDTATRTPTWILYERGKYELYTKELGKALHLFRKAIEKAGIFPEAELALGDVYFMEGELVLAEQQYKKAYMLKNSFYIPEEEYAVLLKLAYLYEIKKEYKNMEDQLLKILENQPYYANVEYSHFRGSFMDTYAEKGLDHLLKLFRIEKVSFATKAHTDLGWFYYRTGRFYQSVFHSLLSINIIVSNSITELRKYHPYYEYSKMNSFIHSSFDRENIKEYLLETNIFRVLYYLASASYAIGYPAHAEFIWNILADPENSTLDSIRHYGDLSRQQIISPWVESYINPSR